MITLHHVARRLEKKKYLSVLLTFSTDKSTLLFFLSFEERHYGFVAIYGFELANSIATGSKGLKFWM